MHAFASISITSPAFSPARLRFASDLTRASLPLYDARENPKTRIARIPVAPARVHANHVRSIPNENRAFDANLTGKMIERNAGSRRSKNNGVPS